MLPSEFTYPSKRTPRPGGDFTVRQFILPIEISNHLVWAWLDTGANISILPKEIASDIVPSWKTPKDSGRYKLAGIVEVPYKSYELNFDILEYIDPTIPELDLEPYEEDSISIIGLQNVEFQVPELTWEEIAERLEATDPLSVHGENLGFVILGLHGVLDQLNLSFVRDNSVSISPHGLN